jgi:hypothetical protein
MNAMKSGEFTDHQNDYDVFEEGNRHYGDN